MAITNYERVGKAMDLLKAGLGPFVQREVTNAETRKSGGWRLHDHVNDPNLEGTPVAEWDVAGLLKLMRNAWNDVFRNVLGRAERGLVMELLDNRNDWAHQRNFSGDDAHRVLDSAGRLLAAVSAPQWDEVEKIRMELLRVRFDEQARGERRRQAGQAIESAAAANLKPWREVVTPHRDVASGRFQQAEFAADLWQVHLGEGTDEYKDPAEFFRRTYLTESLGRMLAGAVRRLDGGDGDPVVQLQTNFGGGKTHAMLALYHLFSGAAPGDLPGIDGVLQEADTGLPGKVQRVVLVGNKISPGNPVTKDDGTVVRTLWGELAWQLGGREAFARIAADDDNATSPGDALRELFNDYGPCLVLIDEWVAYARQLHDNGDLPAGGFETQFSFAQALTESARLADNCLLVISLPASDSSASPHAQADDAEVGGQRGREALDRLRNVVGRIDSSWRPASAEEGFEIVRRRLFEPFSEQAQFRDRDVVARAFADLYRGQRQEFPAACREADYEKRLLAAYPIHPEIFDRLYTDWSTLVKFQRTRGVLRLMAAVIHCLWEKGDAGPLILPANIAMDDPRVQFELTRYLPEHWVPVIEKDVDGLRLAAAAHGRRRAQPRQVLRLPARGADPLSRLGAHGAGGPPGDRGPQRQARLRHARGVTRRIRGTRSGGSPPSATYLYQDGGRYWYSVRPTVTKLAEDRAEQLRSDPDRVAQELDTRLRADLRNGGDFKRVHALPRAAQDVPDDVEARLVVLGMEQPHSRDDGSAAEAAARTFLESRGSAPRIYRNSLVFLAADKTRLQDLDQGVRRYLAWKSIVDESETLELTQAQARQAQTQRDSASDAVTARLPETYQWLLVPVQASPAAAVEWSAIRLTGQDALAARASRRLKNDELLVTGFAGTRLRMELDRVPLWRGDHVPVHQVVEDFARYPYLPRLREASVLLKAAGDGVGLLTWQQDAFAFADSFDDAAGRYRGLRGGQVVELAEPSGLLVKPDVARRQMDEESPQPSAVEDPVDAAPYGGQPASGGEPHPAGGGAPEPPGAQQPTRFHGSVELDAARVGRDASQIAEEVISHLSGLIGARVTVTLEIEAEVPDGAPDNVVRTVTENSRTLKFTSQGFEKE